MLRSTREAEATAGCLLQEGGHVSSTEKTQSASGWESLRYCFQTSQFLPVQTKNAALEFSNKQRILNSIVVWTADVSVAELMCI